MNKRTDPRPHHRSEAPQHPIPAPRVSRRPTRRPVRQSHPARRVGLPADLKEVILRFIDATTYTAGRAWDALDVADIDGASVRLHWTDQPYIWHVNDGTEVFVVLDGTVDMHHRHDGIEHVERLTPGRLCVAEAGDEHVAHPAPTARILVIERKGSI